jgi:TRAP-type C4-dicarboxylate transport system permease small subunit
MSVSQSTPPPTGGTSIFRWLQRRADDVAVALVATMFVCFLLQIVFRYVFNHPLGWTDEVSLLCWLWVVLWCASFIVKDTEEVRLDFVYNAVPPTVRSAFTVVAGVALIVLMALSLPATWRYVVFMRREHSSYLGIRFDYLYSIYLVFAVVCIVRQARVVWQALRGAPPAVAGEIAEESAK